MGDGFRGPVGPPPTDLTVNLTRQSGICTSFCSSTMALYETVANPDVMRILEAPLTNQAEKDRLRQEMDHQREMAARDQQVLRDAMEKSEDQMKMMRDQMRIQDERFESMRDQHREE